MNEEAPRTAPFRWPIAERRRLEDELRQNVESARALYEALGNEYRRASELAAAALERDRELLQIRCRQLHGAMKVALEEWRGELHRFTRLVIHHELPE